MNTQGPDQGNWNAGGGASSNAGGGSSDASGGSSMGGDQGGYQPTGSSYTPPPPDYSGSAAGSSGGQGYGSGGYSGQPQQPSSGGYEPQQPQQPYYNQPQQQQPYYGQPAQPAKSGPPMGLLLGIGGAVVAILLVVLLLFLFVFNKGGGGGGDAPGPVAVQAMKDAINGNYAAACASVAPDARTDCENKAKTGLGAAMDQLKAIGGTINVESGGEATINGDSATVPVKLTVTAAGQTQSNTTSAPMKRVNGKWYIADIGAATP